MDVAIGFDTSCYTTSIAAVNESGAAVASLRALLPVQSGQRGLRQSEAVFAHVRQMAELGEGLRAALAGVCIVAVAASAAPAESEASYMPVFAVGLAQARVLAAALNVPCYTVTHQQGHIAAGQLGMAQLPEPFVALHISGGTTELLLAEGGRLRHIGGSLDLHAGQLIDRVGVALGLGFPAGPALEALARGAAATGALPASLTRGDLDCHLSGAETRCMDWVRKGELPGAQVAAEVFDLLARTVARMLIAASEQTGAQRALAVGGVASSTLLRELVARRLQKAGAALDLRFGQPQYSADNAAGVALLGMQRYRREHSKT